MTASPRPKLNRFDITMIMVSFVIGMGIFRTPVNVAAASPEPLIFYLAWIAGGLVALCGALTYAEIGSRYPVTGGYYKVFSYAYHPSIAFGVNCIILVSNAASVSAVALIGSEYIMQVIMPGITNTAPYQIAIAIFSILLFYGVNLSGLKMSARTQNVLMLIKIGMILLLVTPLFIHSGSYPSKLLASAKPSVIEYIKAFGICLVAVSFTYGGYQQTINFGDEVKDPSRNIPRGIFPGIIIIISLYLLINHAYIRVIGFENLKTSTGIASVMASHVFGNAAGNILSIFLFLSVLAYVNVLLMSNPRVMAAMSDDKVLPAVFGKRTVQKNVLLTSLSVFAAICVLIVFWAESFDAILSFTIFLDSFGMVLSAATIFKLRRATAHLDGSGIYKMKFFPLMPLLFMTAYSFVAVSIFIDSPKTGLTGLAILLCFIGLFFVLRTFQKS